MVSWLPSLQDRFVRHVSTVDSWNNGTAKLHKRKSVKGEEGYRQNIDHHIYISRNEEEFLNKKK